MKLELIVDEKVAGTRLDKGISLLDESLSRNYVQQLLDEERVVVNDKKVKSSYKLKLNDVISVDVPEVSEIDAKPENIPLDILYEDKDIIVINKPKGMVVHPGAGNEEHTLVNALLYHCKDLSGINGKLRPGIVHRIDKDTTGCIVACKNDKAHEAIAEQLVDKTCHRSYLALVYGVIPHESGTIDAPIGRDGSNRQAMTVTDKNAREAVTHFDVVERFKDMTLVKCTLETGRTHQIRVHMRYIGYPVYGDPKYSKSKTDTSVGQYLHAYELALVHPTTGEAMKFSAPMPEYFEAKLKELRGEVIE